MPKPVFASPGSIPKMRRIFREGVVISEPGSCLKLQSLLIIEKNNHEKRITIRGLQTKKHKRNYLKSAAKLKRHPNQA